VSYTTSDSLGVRGFRVSFIPLSGCFSPFPHDLFTIARLRCFAWEGGPPGFPQAFTWLVVLWIQRSVLTRFLVLDGTFTLCGPAFQRGWSEEMSADATAGPQPPCDQKLSSGITGLGSSRFARDYYGNLG